VKLPIAINLPFTALKLCIQEHSLGSKEPQISIQMSAAGTAAAAEMLGIVKECF
jgi:hypothetical protein